jgi:hypothetical protein
MESLYGVLNKQACLLVATSLEEEGCLSSGDSPVPQTTLSPFQAALSSKDHISSPRPGVQVSRHTDHRGRWQCCPLFRHDGNTDPDEVHSQSPSSTDCQLDQIGSLFLLINI